MADFADSLPGEIWKPVAGFENVYFVSNRGRVRTVPKWVNSKNGSTALKSGRLLRPYFNNLGYYTVGIGGKTRTVHRLVCEAFHGAPPFAGVQVAHCDGSRVNNVPENLRWASPKENAADRNIHGTAPIGTGAGNSKLKDFQILEIRAAYTGKYGDLAKLARRFGVTSTQILHIVRRRQWTHI